MKYWAVKRGVRLFWAFVRRPYHTIKPAVDSKTWHDHVCLALRLGPEVYTAFCPHAAERGFEPEVDAQCEQCGYFSTVYASDGKLRLASPAADNVSI